MSLIYVSQGTWQILSLISFPPPPFIWSIIPQFYSSFISLGVYSYHTTPSPNCPVQFLLFSTGMAEITAYDLSTYASTKQFALIIPA